MYLDRVFVGRRTVHQFRTDSRHPRMLRVLTTAIDQNLGGSLAHRQSRVFDTCLQRLSIGVNERGTGSRKNKNPSNTDPHNPETRSSSSGSSFALHRLPHTHSHRGVSRCAGFVRTGVPCTDPRAPPPTRARWLTRPTGAWSHAPSLGPAMPPQPPSHQQTMSTPETAGAHPATESYIQQNLRIG